MNTCISSVLVIAIIIFSSSGLTNATKIRLYNACPFTIWPAWIPNQGSPALGPGGTELSPWQSYDVYASNNWAGRFWGRTKCNFDGRSNSPPGCETGDCSNVLECKSPGKLPATLVQYSLHNNNVDGYSVSVVDGYNLPIRVSATNPTCGVAGCKTDVNVNCPPDLVVRNQEGFVVACKSACLAFKDDKYCCKNQYDNDRCPTNPYAEKFKESCPTAATYAYDRVDSSFTCPAGTQYTVTFCPAGSEDNSLLTLRVPVSDV